MNKDKKQYDLVIVGGGPAGMMASIMAARNGASVLLLEKNGRLGRKLLITGKGRCNITNAEYNDRDFIKNFGSNGSFLFSGLNQFGVAETMDFFESLDLKLKIERGQRVFPISDDAHDVLRALMGEMKRLGVKIFANTRVKSFELKDGKIEKINLDNKKEVSAKNFLIATGGKSYASTGSSGDGYNWLEKMGHEIIEPRPALVPIKVQQGYVKEVEGLSLKNVEISIWQDDKKVDSRFGEALFTHNGLSGPIILDLSKAIGELLDDGKVVLKIDFKPALDFVKLEKRIQRDFDEANNKMFKNSLDNLLPQSMIPLIIKLSEIDPDKKANSITADERKTLVHLLKEFEIDVTRLAKFDRAIVTTGGVDLSEVDPKTMQSKLIENLYLAGEVLDLDGPTGGFNLQVAWTTGAVAGDAIAKN